MRKNDETIKEVFARMFRRPELQEKYQEAMIKQIWAREMGEFIGRRVGNLQYRRGVLTIQVNSAPLKHEISASKGRILYQLNKAIGEELIKDIRVF